MSLSPCSSLDRLLATLDDSARRTLDAYLRDLTRAETVSRLASAMAHDFSNLLMVISGLGEGMLERMPAGDPLRADLIELLAAANRAAGLTTHLLTVSRKPALSPTRFDLDELLRQTRPLIARLVGPHVDVALHLAPSPSGDQKWIVADRDRLEQVLLNLATNARDAMPEGGAFTLRSSVEPLDPPRVALSLTDTGAGIADEARPHIFEPFFTTKPRGKGTGLGLWQARAILAEHHGAIDVHSQRDRGTTFIIHLPLAVPAARAMAKGLGTAGDRRQSSHR